MILCFGTFASVLSWCTQGMPQIEFVPKVAWVLDRKNSSLASGLKSVIDDPDGMEGNKSVVSNLLSCKRPLNIREKPLPSQAVVRERFKSKVMPHISEDMVAKAVLALLYIISKDDTIKTTRRESFRKYLGIYREELLQQTAFNVPDFFARVLLYTTCVDNKEGGPFAREITDTFIESAVKDIWVEVKWETVTQTLQLIPTEQKRVFDEVQKLSEIRFSMLRRPQIGYGDTEWLGIDMNALFPNMYRHIEFKDDETRSRALRKMNQYIKLIRQLLELMIEQRSTADQSAKWPIFPDKKMRDVRQQLKDLYDELFHLAILGRGTSLDLE